VSNRGKLLVASPLLLEPVFHRSVILLLEDNDEGAFGLILNHESDESVEAHLPGWGRLAAGSGTIHIGGPVEPAAGLALAPARSSDDAMLPGLTMIDLESEPEANLTSVRIYAGYTGWAPGQLDFELEEGSWYVVPAAPDDPFDDPDGQWSRVLRRQPGFLAMLATFPDDPGLN
jgi:putative transcriptional regulator